MEYHSGGSLPLLGRPRYCPGANANGGYLCETGHCCGETGCCTYYYELWWFWLLWTVLILFSCCCAYRHRRAKLRVQQQQRQREISLLAYHGASSYPSSMLDLSFLASLKLPSYEEVAAQPSTPPPPYSSVFTTPRYPQPPRTTDPHLLTQHDPLLHRPLSDGPSSLSSENSSSCSCDSCCPSSPCSSSLSVPITYETDTSHASTPSEGVPVTLDVTVENIAAVVTCSDMNQAGLAAAALAAAVAPESSDGAPETGAADFLVPNQTVTVAVVTRAASPQPSSPTADAVLPGGTTAPKQQQLDTAARTSTCSPPPTATVPSTLTVNSEGPSALKAPSVSGSSTPTASTCNSPAAPKTPETCNSLSGSFATTLTLASPASALAPDGGRTLAPGTGLTNPPAKDPILSLEFNPAPSYLTLTPDQPDKTTPPPDSVSGTGPLVTYESSEPSPGSGVGLASPSPGSAFPQPPPATALHVSCPHLAAVPVSSGTSLVPPQPPESNVTSQLQLDVQAGSGSGTYPGTRSSPLCSSAPVPTFTTHAYSSPSSFCPAITIESASSVPAPQSSPVALSPASSPSPPAPTPLPAPALLLDPLAALHQSDKGGSSSGPTSSLSPSPRATQSPPKQTLFSPCVDFFEPEPSGWEDGEPETEDHEDDEEEDMGADESQYRHRRLTGDSGIEVCRCRVEEEEEEEEEEEREEDAGRGEEVCKKGGADTGLHDSVDCPARAQITTGGGITLCNPASTTTPTSEDGGDVIIVMETV